MWQSQLAPRPQLVRASPAQPKMWHRHPGPHLACWISAHSRVQYSQHFMPLWSVCILSECTDLLSFVIRYFSKYSAIFKEYFWKLCENIWEFTNNLHLIMVWSVQPDPRWGYCISGRPQVTLVQRVHVECFWKTLSLNRLLKCKFQMSVF